MIPGYVAWLYALRYYKIIIMVIIIMYELNVIMIIIIVSDNILPKYICVCHTSFLVEHGSTLSKYQVSVKTIEPVFAPVHI